MARKQYWQRAEEFFVEMKFSYNEFTHMWERKLEDVTLFADYSVAMSGIILNVVHNEIIEDDGHLVPRLSKAADLNLSQGFLISFVFKGNEGLNTLKEILE